MTINEDNTLDEDTWIELLTSIYEEKCTPFIGSGAYAKWDILPPNWIKTPKEIALELAKDNEYPLEDSGQLDRVTQFLAIQKDDNLNPKKIISKKLKQIDPPNFSLPEYSNTPYAVLANLNLPIYITTNYDLFLESALKDKGKAPVSEFCVWNTALEKHVEIAEIPSILKVKPKKYIPTHTKPLVYHLYGLYRLKVLYRPDGDIHDDKDLLQSMVLTESDYIDFVISLYKAGFGEESILPIIIQKALATTSLLFIGYGLEEINFRIIFRGLMNFLTMSSEKPSILVLQIPPNFLNPVDTKNYLQKYTKEMFKIHIAWGDTQKFCNQLHERFMEFLREKNVQTARTIS
jgi:SIR2-like protein